eukprot:873877_1
MAAEDSEDTLKQWMKDQNVWHPKLYKVLKNRKIFTIEDFGKLKKKDYNEILSESKFAKPSTLKQCYDNAKPKKKKKKKPVNDDTKDDNETTNTNSKKKKKKSKKPENKRGGKSIKDMMKEYAKEKPPGSSKTNDSISFVGGKNPDND